MLETNLNLGDVCRLCTKTAVSLYNLYDNDNDGISFIEKFKVLCGLEVDNNSDFPRKVCHTCQNKLKTYYDFRNMCLNSQDILKKKVSRGEYINNFIEINNYNEDCEEIRYYIEVESDAEVINEEELLLEDIERFFIRVPQKKKQSKIMNKSMKKFKRKKTENYDPNKKHKCKVCKKRFSSELRVKLHMQRIHKQIYLAECKVNCPKCGMKFQHTRNLKRHLVYHNSDSYFSCEFCSQKSYSKKSWRKHMRIHDENINIICKICNKNILSKLAEIYHMEYHHTKEILRKNTFFYCETCKTAFEHFNEIENHCAEKHCLKIPQEHDYSNTQQNKEQNTDREILNTVRLSENTKEFDKKSMNDKFDEVEQNVEKLFSNTVESNENYNVGVIMNDAILDKENNEFNTNNGNSDNTDVTDCDTKNITKNSNNCDEQCKNIELCSRNENRDTSIIPNCENINSTTTDNTHNKNSIIAKDHQKSNSTHKFPSINASVIFKCNICSRFYKNLPDLKFHVDECYAKVNRPKSFMCDICGKCFSTAWTLTNHKAGHSNARAYICDICGQRFKWHNDLSNHKSRIHEKVRPYVCKICGKKCGTSATLKSHVRLHTGEKPYTCAVCGARFAQNSSLKEHGFKHTGGASVACPICNKVFQTPLRLRTHLKRHNTHRKLYPCDKCGRMFTEKSSVRKHIIKIHHNDN